MTANLGAGLFVDLDGTLADSITVMRKVYSRFLARFGQQGSDAEFAGLNGPPLREVVAAIAAKHRLSPPVEELQAIYLDLIEDAYKDVVPDPAAGDLLQTARRCGIKTGVVTSNSVDLTRSWLRHVGLEGMVDTVVGGDEISRGKPDPQPYLLALERTGCEPGQSLAVEDSLMGVRASMAAGLRTFMLKGDHEDIPQGALLVSGLEEVRDYILGTHQGQGAND